ncbi:MAG TPA: hypothetical protein VFG87_07555 [Amycolatopsis sp.]|jgi:hypothetical protein|nr:hypothetical protein [Amycolatopsis sp.]
MADEDRVPDGGADRVRNDAANIDGPVVQVGSVDGDITIGNAPAGRWYRDPFLLVPAIVTIIAAVIALVPYLFPHQEPTGTGTGLYVDPEECLALDWPGPGTAAPQRVHAAPDVVGDAVLRPKPCWRAGTPQTVTRFSPATGISVFCWLNADNVYDSSGVPRYRWYLVADPTQPGKTIGWTPRWPYSAPSQPVPECGAPSGSALSPVTIVATVLAGLTVVFLITAIIRRRRRVSGAGENSQDQI